MKGAIFDTMPSLNSNPAKNKFLSACSSPSAAMPTACPSFMKIIRQFHDNSSQSAAAIGVLFYANYRELLVNFSKIIRVRRPHAQRTNLRLNSRTIYGHLRSAKRLPLRTCCRKCFAARGRTPVLIGYGRGFYLQACLQGKDRDGGYRQQNRIIVE